MGVHTTYSTMLNGHTPICNDCDVALCWDIKDCEYQDQKEFWDEWKCRDCNPDYEGALKRWLLKNRAKPD